MLQTKKLSDQDHHSKQQPLEDPDAKVLEPTSPHPHSLHASKISHHSTTRTHHQTNDNKKPATTEEMIPGSSDKSAADNASNSQDQQ